MHADAGKVALVGWRKLLRVLDSKPDGITEFKATCPVHGEQGRMDRIHKVQAYLQAHAMCR